MSSSSSSYHSTENNQDSLLYEPQKYDTLVSGTTQYLVVGFNGEGRFGKVAKCVNLLTGKDVALKIHKDNINYVIKAELKMLQKIRSLDPDRNHIVQFMEHFSFKDVSCLAFEMLDRSLWDLMEDRHWNPLSLNEIRPVIYQLMVAFDALKSIGIVHTDLKPDNIMLVNHRDQPFKIKLIDFGLARLASRMLIGMTIQPFSFRAPEVTLGLRLTEAVDMWGVGCTMAFLYFGTEIFPRKCFYNLIRRIVHLLGQPEDHVLNAGEHTDEFFSLNDDPHSPRWRLNTPDEYEKMSGIQARLTSSSFFDSVENLEDAVQTYSAKKNDIEYEDRMAFLSLLKSTLDLDPERRVVPRESLKKPFLSMVHLENKMDTNSYPDEACQRMSFMPLNHLDSDSDGAEDSSDSSEVFYSLPILIDGNDSPPKEAEVAEEKQREQQETISPAPALESQRGAEGNLPNRRAEPSSVWKRVRHFLGLRKPEG